jgi:predicted aldo/keto reductase-like oxidoreductase
MLYRHFPKIANKEFSILTLSLEAGDPAKNETLLDTAIVQGINLVYAGRDQQAIARAGTLLERKGLKKTVSMVYEFTGKTAADLTAFLAATGNCPGNCAGDFLLIRVESAEDAEAMKAAGVFSAAAQARQSGAAGYLGFSVPPSPDAIHAALDSFALWDFWATDFNYLQEGLVESIREVSRSELSFFSLDPFAGGKLERIPAEVHKLFEDAPVPRSNDEWGLRAVWEVQDSVSAVIRPETPEDLFRKSIFAEAGRANSLPSREMAILEAAAAMLVK